MKKIMLVMTMIFSGYMLQASDRSMYPANNTTMLEKFLPETTALLSVTLASFICSTSVCRLATCPRIELSQQQTAYFTFKQLVPEGYETWHEKTNRSLVVKPQYQKINQPASKKRNRRG